VKLSLPFREGWQTRWKKFRGDKGTADKWGGRGEARKLTGGKKRGGAVLLLSKGKGNFNCMKEEKGIGCRWGHRGAVPR